MTTIDYTKMSAHGNDFIIIDSRETNFTPTPEQVKTLAKRNSETGGCDQVIVIKDWKDGDVSMKTYNADGSKAEWCGNACKCVASLLCPWGKQKLTINTDRTPYGLIFCHINNGTIIVEMGKPNDHKLFWLDCPPHENIRIRQEVFCGVIGIKAIWVDFGNPHLILRTSKPLNDWAMGNIVKEFEKDYEHGINIEFVCNADRYGVFRVRVWERGVGITQSCGSGGSAVAWMLHAEGLIKESVKLQMDGGDIEYKIDKNDVVRMIGGHEIQYPGTITLT